MWFVGMEEIVDEYGWTLIFVCFELTLVFELKINYNDNHTIIAVSYLDFQVQKDHRKGITYSFNNIILQ